VTYSSSNATNATNTTTYYLYKVKIDQFTSLKLSKISSILTNASAVNAIVTVQFQNQAAGQPFLLLNKTNNIQRSILSIVVNTVTGTFDSISGDNFCDSGCGNCYNGECFDNVSANGSDLMVYISWGGSDSKSNQYLSQS
jgi:hypothetical protein